MIGRAWRAIYSLERTVLAALFLIAASLLVFVRLGSEIAEGEIIAFDRAILLALRAPGDPGLPLGPPWFRELMINLTALGSLSVLLLVSLLAIGYLLVARRARIALFVLTAAGGGLVFAALLKLAYQRPRPELVPHLVNVSSTSFPSGHAADSAIVYLTLAVLIARTVPDRAPRLYLLAAAMLLTFLVGLSRIYLGVHWPSDVAAGWAFGAAWALACSLAYAWFRPAAARIPASAREIPAAPRGTPPADRT